MLLDGETLDLVQHVEAVLAATEGHELEQRVNAELMQSVLEIATPVCSSPAEVDRELRKLRAYVAGLASGEGMKKALILKVDLRAPHLEVTRGKIPKKQ